MIEREERMGKSVAYYQGCSLEGLAVEFDRSTRAVCRALDIELVEIPDWNRNYVSEGGGSMNLGDAIPTSKK